MVAMMIVDAKTFEVDTVSGSSGYRIETSPQKKPSLVVGKNLTMKVMTTRKTALAAVKTGEKRVTKRPPSMQLQQQLTPLPLDLFHVGSGMVTNAIFSRFSGLDKMVFVCSLVHCNSKGGGQGH